MSDGPVSVKYRSLEDRELDSLSRHYAGLIQQIRLEAFDERLTALGPQRVRFNQCGLSGDRWLICLDDGTLLRLKLYSPRHAAVAAVCSVRWHHDSEWCVEVRQLDGDPLVLRAYHAELHPGSLACA